MYSFFFFLYVYFVAFFFYFCLPPYCLTRRVMTTLSSTSRRHFVCVCVYTTGENASVAVQCNNLVYHIFCSVSPTLLLLFFFFFITHFFVFFESTVFSSLPRFSPLLSRPAVVEGASVANRRTRYIRLL